MSLEETFRDFADDVDFIGVYVKEAHAADGSQSPDNITDDVIFNTPTTLDERAEIATACQARLQFPFPMVLDEMGDEVTQAYRASPTRLYLLDADGRIAWKSGLGPHYLDVEGFASAVKEIAGG